MKVCIATGLYAPEIGGPATYTAFLEKHLPDLGIDLVVVPFRNVRKYPRFVRHVAYFFSLMRAGRHANIIYALDTVSVGVPAMLASMVLRKPLYVRVPGDYAWEQGQQRFGITETLDEYLKNPKKPIPVRILAWLQRSVVRYAARVVVPSDYLKRIIAMWGIETGKIIRIYSELKEITIPESKDTLRVALGYEGFVVVTAARLVPWKGIRALIDAVVALRIKGLPISLTVIGDGVERKSLEEHAGITLRGMEKAPGGRHDVIRFLGALPRDILGKYLKASDVFVLNTSYEGLSHQLIEVMSLGTPIVTTPVGGNVELIDDDVSGIFVPWNETAGIERALERLYQEPELGLSLAAKARKKTELFHEDVIAHVMHALFL